MIGPFARIRRALYGRGILPSGSLPRPVISVGNLTAGGAGKTPHVQFLARFLCGEGHRPAILSRGYRRRTRGVVWASDGKGTTAGAREVGDEPALLARTVPGVPVLVGESRLAAGRECLRAADPDLFLLDDGFQHLALRRDLDLLLVDGETGFGNGRTLPLGPLREPPSHVRFAHAVIATKCRDAAQGERRLASIPPVAGPRAISRLVPRAMVSPDGQVRPLPSPGEETAAFCGLADDRHFLATLRDLGFRVREFLPFPDHHGYSLRDLERIRKAAGGSTAVTTEKDLVRLPRNLPFPVLAIRVEVEFLAGWGELSRLLLAVAGGGAP